MIKPAMLVYLLLLAGSNGNRVQPYGRVLTGSTQGNGNGRGNTQQESSSGRGAWQPWDQWRTQVHLSAATYEQDC